jgi:hypothetical protein
MNYVKIVNDAVAEYPYQIGKIRQENPGTSFPSEMSDSLLAEYNVFPVTPVAPPSVTIYERAVEGTPTLANGAWQQAWNIVAAPSPDSITRRQCALQLLATQTITAQEALAMTKSAEVPAAVAAILDQAVADQLMTPEQRILAEIDFAAANYFRDNPLLGMMGLTPEQLDQFFIAASQL